MQFRHCEIILNQITLRFLTSAPFRGRGRILQNSVLVGGQDLKTNLYNKIWDPIFDRIAGAMLSQWVSGRTLLYRI